MLSASAELPAAALQTDVLTVFFTGSELGALKPCGCSGGQLGGLDRRSSILNSVSKQARLIVDTGSLVASDAEQDLVKFRIVVEAFKLLGYDLVNLTDSDVQIAGKLGLLDDVGSSFGVISAAESPGLNLPARFTRKFSLAGKTAVVTIAAFNAESGCKPDQLRGFFPDHPGIVTTNILIVDRCDSTFVGAVAARAPFVDCLVCPSDSDEPRVLGDPNRGPLVFSVGRFGRYVCKLEVRLQPQKKAGFKQLAYYARHGQIITLSAVPVAEDLPPAEPLVKLYKYYQQLVKEDGFLERYPRFSLPDQLQYAGSQSCKFCHEYAYEKWSGQAHARAYATLEKAGSQFDPECVICHVVGMQYQSGFVSEEKTDRLKDVGCETCHGPGSDHIGSLGKNRTRGPKLVCLDCHTPEHSAGYAGNERVYLEKIVHWTEPNAPRNVKE